MTVKPIRTEHDYQAALARISSLMNATAGTAEGDELDVLVDLVEAYEAESEPMGFPDPIAAIEFRMEQAGFSRRDLAPLIGSPAEVAEVLSGRRELTLSMARVLHKHLGIPSEVLIRRRVQSTAERTGG